MDIRQTSLPGMRHRGSYNRCPAIKRRLVTISSVCCSCALLIMMVIYVINYTEYGWDWFEFHHARSSSFNFQYTPPWSNATVRGKPMKVDVNWLSHIGFPLDESILLDVPVVGTSPYNDIKFQLIKQLTFVTASSANHFQESLDSIASVQSHFPGHKIVYYDLGLLDDHIDMLETLCDVEYRESPLQSLPLFIQRLDRYRWKPLLIHLALLEFPAVFWMDTSVRFLENITVSNLPDLIDFTLRGVGVTIFEPTGHSLFAVTNPGTFTYIPVNVQQAASKQQYSAIALYLRTRRAYTSIVRWLVLCALVRRCLVPEGAYLRCHFKGTPTGKYSHYAGCHRFDQSVLNILLLNEAWAANFDTQTYVYGHTELLRVERFVSRKDKLKECH